MVVQCCNMAMVEKSSRLAVRILATTDLHMNLLGYDYFLGRENPGTGLAAVATLIEESRVDHRNCLLFDNGDSLQGTPLGDYIAESKGVGPGQPHPLVQVMNQLGYDAATLGNHDFTFGGDFLLNSVADAGFPLVATNLHMKGAGHIRRSAILTRRFTDDQGAAQDIRIGILGFLPPQTTDWDSALRPVMRVDDIIETARTEVPLLKAQGADLIIALAHSGIAGSAIRPRMENAALPLAEIPGIDVIIAGHIHRAFPSADFPPGPGVDPIRGLLHGKPAVMAGFWGSHLGVIDLGLVRGAGDGGWQVEDATSRAVQVPRDSQPMPAITAALQADHQATIRHLSRRIASSTVPMHSFLSLLGQDAGLNLVNQAQADFIRAALAKAQADCDALALPVLAAAAPSRAGGRGGPGHYTDVPPGDLTLRSLADLYLYPNRICALELTGGELADWLERAAGIFRQIHPDQADQPLLDPNFPSYNFDVITGLEWQIDLSQPARYDPSGAIVNPAARRIRDLTHQGKPVEGSARFILVTNSYRMSECGLYAPLARPDRLVIDEGQRARDMLLHHVQTQEQVAPPSALGFRFAPLAGASVTFDSGPLVSRHLDVIAPLSPQIIGTTPEGFTRLRLHL